MTDYATPHDPDFWPRLIERLNSAGTNRADLSRALKVHPSTVTRWAQGINRPKFDESIALLGIAKERGIAVTQPYSE